MEKKLLYISGCHHGGTTLLHRLLGAHPRFTSLGSVRQLTRAAADRSEKRCSCGQSLSQCKFWGSVANYLNDASGRAIDDLDVNNPDATIFETDNRLLFDAARAASGATFIVDSSRDAVRLNRLQDAFGRDAIVPIHIYRRPEAQINSWKRKQKSPRPYLGNIWEYNRLHFSRFSACRRANTMRLISYERLCNAPDATISTILNAVGQTLPPNLLSHWGDAPAHVLGGNRMLRVSDSVIRLDDSWRSGLTRSEIILARVGCMPIYLHLQHQADQPFIK